MTQLKRLNELHRIQKDILLVQHLNPDSYWNTRCFFLDEFYNAHPKYLWNHRCILNNELVLEYDTDDTEMNHKLALFARRNLDKDGIKSSMWFSGNKSYHVHFFMDCKNPTKLGTLKRVLLKYYGTIHLDKDYLPDLAMASSHNIRLEYGIHEKTQKTKTLRYQDKGYFTLGHIKDELWSIYNQEVRKELSNEVQYRGIDLSENPKVKLILDTANFRKNDDGRERALFLLIHILKSKYNEEDLTRFLQTWYRYSGGTKLSEVDIQRKIKYHYNRRYIITYTSIENLLYEIGLE
jgi:hypothetical protein